MSKAKVKGSKVAKGLKKAKAQAKKVIKEASAKVQAKGPKTKVEKITPHDFNANNEVGSENTPKKLWCQFPCNDENNLKIKQHAKGLGYGTFASYVQDLIAKDLKLKK